MSKAASNLGDFLAAEHQDKFKPQANNSSCYASWFYCAHKARGVNQLLVVDTTVESTRETYRKSID